MSSPHTRTHTHTAVIYQLKFNSLLTSTTITFENADRKAFFIASFNMKTENYIRAIKSNKFSGLFYMIRDTLSLCPSFLGNPDTLSVSSEAWFHPLPSHTSPVLRNNETKTP